MDRIVELPNRSLIEQEAAEWLIRLDGENTLSTDEMVALREWMHQSPLHKDELVNLCEFWSNQSLVSLPIPLESLYQHGPAENRIKPASKLSKWAWSTASIATAMLLITLGLKSIFTEESTNRDQILYATAVGQQQTFELDDGSVISLNTNSQVKINYNERFRSIFLMQGEAHFDVAKNTERPFRVYAGSGWVEAVGTGFTVYFRNSDKIDVTVTEGRVSVGAISDRDGKLPSAFKHADTSRTQRILDLDKSGDFPAGSLEQLGILDAGQITTILAKDESSGEKEILLDEIKSVAQDEIEKRGAWRSGAVIFNGDSLEEVIQEMKRYNTFKIEITDPEIKQLRIGGRFSVHNTYALFDALEANFGLKVDQMDYNHFQISSNQK